MLPRYQNTNIPHVAISTAILNTINSTNIKTNAYHPSKDKLALDSSELIEQAREMYGTSIDIWLNLIQTHQVAELIGTLSINEKSKVIKDLLGTLLVEDFPPSSM